MDIDAIARALGMAINGLAGAAFLAFLASTAAGASDPAGAFLLTAIVSAFVGAPLRLASLRGEGAAGGGGAREALLLCLLGWTVLPAFAACAFLGEGGAEDYLAAYTDAVSALTTTGFTPSFLRPEGSAALVYWWAFLQWVGGLASIVTALVVLAALNLTGPGVHRSALFTLDPEHLFDRFAPVGKAVLSLYAAVSGVCALALLLGGLDLGVALTATAAAVSTGGLVTPNGEVGAGTLGEPALIVLAVGLAFGALNFALHWDVVRGRAHRPWYIADGETRAAIALLVLAIAMVWFVGDLSAGLWGRAAFEAGALVATAGWDAGAGAVGSLGAPIALALVMIGGSPVSTAGGVKVLRVVLLLRHAAAELRHLAHPSSVAEVRFRGRILYDSQIMGLLLYVIGFTGAVTGLTLALTYGGASFDIAFIGAVAVLSNAGPVAEALSGAQAGELFATTANQVTMCVGMILGRVEVLAAFAVTSRGFWRR